MFSGLIEERGRLLRPLEEADGGLRLTLEHGPELGARLRLGASLAVDGVCLTVVELAEGRTRSAYELSLETLRRTTLGDLEQDAEVNLEPALEAGQAMGGHWVQGHVDTMTRVLDLRSEGEHLRMGVAIPEGQEAFVVDKGSVTLSGVSLTVAELEEDRFSVWLVPHTLERTTLRDVPVGARLNFEADILAKYVAKQLEHQLRSQIGNQIEERLDEQLKRRFGQGLGVPAVRPEGSGEPR